MSDEKGKWRVFGKIAEEQTTAADGITNLSTTTENQESSEYTEIYDTDSREEAVEIIKAGGFELNLRFHVAVWAENTETNEAIGAKPAEQTRATTRSGAKRKSDYGR